MVSRRNKTEDVKGQVQGRDGNQEANGLMRPYTWVKEAIGGPSLSGPGGGETGGCGGGGLGEAGGVGETLASVGEHFVWVYDHRLGEVVVGREPQHWSLIRPA